LKISAVNALWGSGLLVATSVALGQVEPVAGTSDDVEEPRAAGASSVDSNGESRQEAGIEEVIVTARRKEESLQDVPLTVNAVSSEDLQDLNIRELEDISSVVAGLTLDADAIAPNASLRGVRFDAFASGNNPTVQFYINDAPAVSIDAVQAMFDLGQVEVLRGPQGTVRGRAAPSGAITLTTAKPDLETFSGYVDLTATDKEGRNARAAVNLPIVENTLGLRVAGLFEENEGSGIDSINNNEPTEIEADGFRASLRYQPFETLTIDLMHQRIRPDRAVNPQVESANRADPSQPEPSQGPIAPSDRLAVSDIRTASDQVIDFSNVNINWDFDILSVEYVGSVRDSLNQRKNADDAGDFFGPGSNPALQDLGQELKSDTDGQTHELRLESSLGMFEYAVGGLYQNFETVNDVVIQTPVFLPAAFGGGFLTVAETPVDTNGDSTEKSIYGNLTWQLSDATEISGGLRFIDFENAQTIRVSGATISDQEDSWTETVYMLSAKHRFSDELMGYATAGTSWRPGVKVVGNFNTQQTARERSFQNLDPETSESVELGVKADLLERRLRLNGAVFFQQFENFVYRAGGDGVFYVSTDRDGTESVEQFNFVAGVPADVFGVEVEAVYQATERWIVGGLYSWAEGLIDNGTIPCNDYLPADGQPDTSGREPTVDEIRSATGGDNVAACNVDFRANFAPLWTAALRSEYSFPVFGMDAFARGLLTLFGDSKNDPTNAIDDVDRYSVLDVFVGIRSPDRRWDATLFVKNAADTERVLSREGTPASVGFTRFNPVTMTAEGDSGVSTYREITVSDERELGISLRYNF
jgi:iron complex outermembrane recepter protein